MFSHELRWSKLKGFAYKSVIFLSFENPSIKTEQSAKSQMI